MYFTSNSHQHVSSSSMPLKSDKPKKKTCYAAYTYILAMGSIQQLDAFEYLKPSKTLCFNNRTINTPSISSWVLFHYTITHMYIRVFTYFYIFRLNRSPQRRWNIYALLYVARCVYKADGRTARCSVIVIQCKFRFLNA